MAKKNEIKTKKNLKKFKLLNEIKHEKHYSSNVPDRDHYTRVFIEKNIKKNIQTIPQRFMLPGQVCYFKYLTPLTKEQLEYYDAQPVVLVFGTFRTQDGELRILGFNLHYYPPKIRFNVLDRIFDIYKKIYTDITIFENGLKKQISQMQYKRLLNLLAKYKLDFGVREYIPGLIKDLRVIPPKYYSKAVLTEGVFKKSTRGLILKYWSNFHSSARQIVKRPPKKNGEETS